MSELIDGREKRKEILKGIIRDLHQGKEVEELKNCFADLIRNAGPTEISELEEELIKEGISEKEIKKLCDVHVALFRDALDEQEKPEMKPGHPVHTFRMENDAIKKVITSLQEMFKKLEDGSSLEENRKVLEDQLKMLQEIEKHFLRKENQLFPVLEKNGVTGPPKVMWQIHDDIRRMLKEIFQHFENGEKERFIRLGKDLTKAISEMIYKEENILFPMALEKLSESDWGRVRYGEEEIGYTLVSPGNEWHPPKAEDEGKRVTEKENKEILKLATGEMTHEQVNLMLTHLPVDLAFVDENDTVRYYSQGPERIFPRSPGIIGRKVQNCHPQDSVHVVNKIVEEFKKGTKDKAEFWIQMNGRFIHIRYFAVRDGQGEYRGVVEVTQDITDIKKLEGEKRLLEW